MTRPTSDRLPEGWDQAAEAYDKVVFPITSKYARAAVEMLRIGPGERLLDVAAGSGAATIAALEAGAQVVATDFAERMVELLKVRAGGSASFEALVMDGQDLRFDDSSFDKAISVFGLIFFPDRVQGLKEIERVLKPGGRAAIVSWSTPDRTWPISMWGMTLYQMFPDLPRPTELPAVYSLSDPARIEQEMKEAGFKDISVTPVVYTFDGSSPEQFWDEWHAASPVFTDLAQTIGDRIDDYKNAIIQTLREKSGDGEFAIESEAFISIGTKG